MICSNFSNVEAIVKIFSSASFNDKKKWNTGVIPVSHNKSKEFSDSGLD